MLPRIPPRLLRSFATVGAPWAPMERAHRGILLWSGPAHRKIQRLDGHGGLRSFESAGAESEEAKENSVGQCSSAKLWVHFPQATKEATDAFKDHVTEFVLPAEDGCAASNKFVHAVRKSLNNAPPHYADFAFRTTATMAEPTEQPKDDLNMGQQSAIHLSFQLYQSSQICRLFATPDICLTQISPCLNLEDVFDDLAIYNVPVHECSQTEGLHRFAQIHKS